MVVFGGGGVMILLSFPVLFIIVAIVVWLLLNLNHKQHATASVECILVSLLGYVAVSPS